MKDLLLSSRYLERAGVHKILEEAVQLPLIMVVAPMGFGKTTAVQEFLRGFGGKQIWLPFGQNEVDAVWIWNRFCDKFDEAGYDFAATLRKAGLPENQYQVRTIQTIMQNAFAEPCYIVLDDFHECENEKIARFVESIAYAKIPNLHIFVLSRTYPAINYDELWMKNICLLIGQSSLAFERQEIREFFAMNKITLNQEEEDEIYQYTEGWMSAVYLVLMDYLQNGSFHNYGGINNLVKNYIYGRISEEGKKMLMLLSPLDEFTVNQAVYITQMEACSTMIPHLSVSIGFLKYNPNTGCYSIHDVLRAVVSSELELSQIDRKALYNRIADWYEKEKSNIYAVKYYEKAGNTQQIFELIKRCKCAVLFERAPVVMETFFAGLLKEEALAHPLAYLPYLWEMILRTDITRCWDAIEEAREYYTVHTCEELPKNQILGELYLVQWNLEFNDLDKMTECAIKASELLDNKRSTIFCSNFILTFGAPETLFLYHRKPGELKRMVELEKRYTQYYMRLLNGVDSGWDFLFEAEYLYTTGSVEEAEKLSDLVCEKSVIRRQGCIIISSYFLKLRCQIFLGRKEKFEELADQLRELMEEEINNTIRMDYDIAMGYLYGCLGQTEKISSWLFDFDLENCNRIIRSVRGCCVVYGMVLIKNQEWVRLEVLADEMSVPYSVSAHIYVQIYAQIYYTISAYHLYGKEAAVDQLKKGLAIAKEDSVKMPFVDYAAHIQFLLKELKEEDAFAEEIVRLGEMKERGAKAIGIGMEVKSAPAALTDREMELMLLVAKGYKNTEIGSQMNIALVTVEKKLTSVYRKLEVTNRTAALSLLYEYGMLD